MNKMYLIKLLIIQFIFSLFIFSLAPASVQAREVYDAEIRYLHIQKGQTLHNIVKRLYPSRQKEWPQLTKDIVSLNPHAFVNSDPTKMKAGVRLKLPKKVVVSAKKPRKKVGTVVESSGKVAAVDKSKVSRKLNKGSTVYLGDRVVTGEEGFVRLRMIDNAMLDLHCFSIMVIEDYSLDTTSRRSILNLLQGSLKKVTGKIGKMADDIYELKTPVASVGVRGTEYALRVFQAKGCGGTIDTDEGFYLEVIKGIVDVHNEAGSETIVKGETAYVPIPEAAPRKVKIKPGILKPVEKVKVAEPVPEPKPEPEEESSSSWWWVVLGIVGIALLI
ncbi:MAG: FecR domain-containing protein [Proteobacteria bacterium]|nr:FecR domain-containing protein [Pseudomonadota bacterium]